MRVQLMSLVALSLSACNLPDATVIQPHASGTQLHPLGYRYNPAKHHNYSSLSQALVTTPPSADISQFNPPVGDQGQIGDCTTWGAGYAMSGYLSAQAGTPGLFSPMFIFTQFAPSGSTDYGLNLSQVFGLMQSTGIDTAADYDQQMPKTFADNQASFPGLGADAASNDTVDKANAATIANAGNFRLQRYQMVFDTYATGTGVCPGYPGGTAPIQATIAGGSPVSVAIPVPPEFDNYDGVNPVQPPTPAEVSRGGHVIFCSKYDPQGLWCQNSWGTGWGKAGWVQLSWAFVEQCVYESQTASGFNGPAQALPSAAIVSPQNGAFVSGTTPVLVSVSSGANPISAVSLQVSGATVGNATANGDGTFSYALDTTALPNGAATLEAVVVDSQGNQVASPTLSLNVQNGAPPAPATGNLVVTFLSPTSGQTVRGTSLVQVASSGAAPGVTVQQMSFSLDGSGGSPLTLAGSTAQVTFNSTAVTDGSHTLTVTAVASDGETAQATITVTVDNAAPQVTLATPGNGAPISGVVELDASASDNLSAVVEVDFYADGAFVGGVSAAPFSLQLDTTTLANGSHTLSALATDGAGNVAQGSAVTVDVEN